jgi:hypothetical protein
MSDVYVIGLSSGQEVIASISVNQFEHNYARSEPEFKIEFPQQIRWWRDAQKGQCFEFIPFLYGANLQKKMPLNKNHVISIAEANPEITTHYRKLVDDLLNHMERMVRLKRQADEGDSKDLIEVRPS